MAHRRHLPHQAVHYGAQPDEVYDWDASMQQALQHESVEALRHQLEVERDARAAMQRSDYFFTLGAIAFFGGLGYAVGALEPQVPAALKRKRRRRS